MSMMLQPQSEGVQPTPEMIEQALDRITSRQSSATIHTGLIWSLMMSYERQVKQDEFDMTASLVHRLIYNLGKLDMLYATKDAVGDGIPKDTFNVAHKQLVELCEELRKMMQDRMKLVFECPVKTGRFKDIIN